MRQMICVVALCFVAAGVARGEVGEAGEGGAAWASLADGEVRYVVPEGWTSTGEAGPLAAAYATPEGDGTIAVQVAVQKSAIPNTTSVGRQLGRQMANAIAAQAKGSGVEVLQEPRLVTDGRFLARVYARFRENGKVYDRLYLMQALGYNLVTVSMTALEVDEGRRGEIFAAAETLAQGLTLSRRDRPMPTSAPVAPRAPAVSEAPGTTAAAAGPVVLRRAKLEIAPPEGYRGLVVDNASGTVATYRHAEDPATQVVVSVRPAGADEAAAARELARAEEDRLRAGSYAPASPATEAPDGRFLSRSRRTWGGPAGEALVTSRQRRVGDVVVSVMSVAPLKDAGRAEAAAEAADALAAGAGPAAVGP